MSRVTCEKMTKIYIYKLTTDNGGAPCIKDGTLSLAICKPAIRSTAVKDHIILGFAANSLYSDSRYPRRIDQT